MVVRHVSTALLTVVALLGAGCDVVTGNPFDVDRTPVDQQAKATVSGVFAVAGCQSAAGVTLVLLQGDTVASQTQTLSAGGDAVDGTFRFIDVTPGSYRLELRRDGLPAATGETVTLLPGDAVDLGRVVAVPVAGTVDGELRLADNAASDGATIVAVGTSAVCGDNANVSRLGTVTGGRFLVPDLPPGVYEVRAFRTGYTIDREQDVVVGTADTAVVSLQRQLVLHPASAVLRIVDDIGTPLRFTNAPSASLEVLAFGGLSEMRLGRDAAAFDDPEAGWLDHQALVSGFDLGAQDGPVTVFAQLRDGVIVSDIYEATVVLDTTAPSIRELLVDGGAAFLSGNEGNVRLVASDAGSGIAGTQISLSPLGDAFDLSGAPVGFPGDVAREQVVAFQNAGGTFADGAFVVRARVMDGAGNVSAEVTTTIRRDSTPPLVVTAPGIVVDNAVAGELRGQRAELSLALGGDGADVDGPASLEVSQVGGARVYSGVYVDRIVVDAVAGDHGQSVSFTAVARDVAGNALTVTTAPVTLNLRGRLFGRVLLDGVAETELQHGGTTVEATLSGTTQTVQTVTTGSGAFVLNNLPSGEWIVRALRAGAVSQSQQVTVSAGVEREVFFGRLSLARGAISAVFERAGLQPGEDHAGILVEITHPSGFRRQAFTSADGSVLLESLPERVADEAANEPGYELVASSAGFAAARLAGVSVRRDETLALNDASSPIVLARRVGDFEVCTAAPVNNACQAVVATRQTQVFLNLRAENVTHVRIRERTSFANANDAGDPAFVAFPSANGTPFSVTLTDPDGSRRIFVQFKDDQGDADPDNDTLGPVLEASVILDRAPPRDIAAVAVRRDFSGTLDTVTELDRLSSTNHPQARVRLAIDASEDPVEEAGLATIRVSRAADLSNAISLAFAPLRDVVVDAGQILPDGRIDLFVAFCDRADNCTPAAQAVRVPIVIDRQVPSTTNGLRFKADNTASQVTRDPAGAPDGGVFTTFIRSTSLPIAINLGTDPARDVNNALIPEVAAVRVSLDPNFLGRTFIPLQGLAGPGQTVVLPDVGLAGAQGTQRVFLQFQDHAGNVTPIGAGNPFFFDVVLDTEAPEAAISLITAVGQSNFYRRDDPLSVRVESSGQNAARSVRFSTDGVFDTEPTVVIASSPLTVQVPVGGEEGSRQLVARFTDVAGNVAERTLAFFRDVTPPDEASFAQCASCVDDGGPLFASDPLGQVTLDLFAQDNSGFIDRVDVFVDGVLVDGGRTFARFLTATMSPVPGPHTVRVDFVDAAGNVRTAPTLTITQDAAAPVPGVPPVLLLSSTGTPLLDGAIVARRDLRLQIAAAGADRMVLSEDSGCTSGTTLPFATSANLTVGPGEGLQRRVFARFLDRAGNPSSCASGRAFFLDETPPTVTVAAIQATGGVTNTRTATIRVDATDNSTTFGGTLRAHLSRSGAFLADDGDGERIVTLDVDGSTTFTYALLAAATPTGAGDGLKTIAARIIDTAGHITERSLTVILDETLPAKPTPVAPAPGAFVTTTTPTFTWTAAAEATRYRIDIRRAADNVVVQSQEVTVTSFTPTVPLPAGAFRWAVRAFDGATNDSGLDPTFNPPNGLDLTVDVAAPTAPAALAVTGGSPTTNRQPTLTWTQSTDTQTAQAQLSYTVEVAAVANFASVAVSGVVTGAGAFAMPVALTDGTWFWRVTARDRAGNATTTTAPAPFAIDTTPPIAVALAEVRSPRRPPVVLSWTTPTDADRVGVRVQLSESATFGTLLLNSLETGTSRDVTALLSSGTTYFVRVAAEDALGNRNFLSVASFAFDSVPPSVPATPVVALRADGTAFPADALVIDRTIGIRLNAGIVGETVFARVSNNPDCSNPTTFSLDQPGTNNNVFAWPLSSGGAFKQVFVRFFDEAGNSSACVSSQRLRSSGSIRGTVNVLVGSSGLTIGSAERANVRVVLSGATPGLPVTTVTNGDGTYAFAGIPIPDVVGTNHTLTFVKDGFVSSGTVAVAALPDQEVVAAAGTLTVQSGSVSGTVTVRHFSPGGSFCASTDPQNATTTTMTLDGTAFTGEQVTRTLSPAANGTFSFTGVPAGTWALLASREGSAVTSSLPNPFSLAPAQVLVGRNFTIDDRVAPTAPLLRLLETSPTTSANATVAIDLGASDLTSPSNLRGYDVLRVALPLPGDTSAPQSATLGVFSAASTSLSLGLVDQRINRLIVTPVDCAGNRGTAAEVQIVRDSVRPDRVTNVRVDNRDGSVVASWDASPSTDVVSYRVYYGALDSTNRADYTGAGAAQGPSPLVSPAAVTPSQNLSALINDTTFFVAVTAVDAAGNESQLLSERALATPSRAPIDLRFESTIAQTCAQGSDIIADLDATDRLVVVTTGLATPGLLIFENDGRDELTLVGSVPNEARSRVTLLGDFALVYTDTGASGDTRIYDLRDPTAPVLVSAGNALDSCAGCVFRHISNEGFAPINGGATFYGATYRINDTTERLATWRRNVPTNRNLFTFTGGSFIDLNIQQAARGFLQVGELFFVQHGNDVSMYRMTATGTLEHIVNRPGGTSRQNSQMAYADPYLFVPGGGTSVRVFLVNPGTRTAGAGASGATFSEIGQFTTRAVAQAVLFAGTRLLVMGTTGQTQRVVEAFDQSGLTTSLALGQRTMPTSLGSTILRAENAISQFTMVNAKVVGSQLPALFHFSGSGNVGCPNTRRELRLKLFELGSGRAMAEGIRIPRAGASMNTTRFTDLRGGVLVTTENNSSTTRIKAYDVRDLSATRLLAESVAFDGDGDSASGGGPNDISGLSARSGSYVFTSHADNSPRSRRIGVVDVAFPQSGIRTVTVGTDNPFNATNPENVLAIQVVSDVVVMATGDSFNNTVNSKILAVVAADTPSSLPPWTQVDAGTGMAGTSLFMEGGRALLGATATGLAGRLCEVNISSLTVPSFIRCIEARSTTGAAIGRAFTGGAIPGHIILGAGAGFMLYDVRGGLPVGVLNATRQQAIGLAAPIAIKTSGSQLFGAIGNSSTLPLGALLAFDLSRDLADAATFSIVGSSNDADAADVSNLTVSGNRVLVPSTVTSEVVQFVELF